MREARRPLAGRYELDGVLGRGGMGTVHRATDLVLGRTVAVKLLPAAVAQEDPRHVARFEREARATARLAHRGVVAIYDTGQDEDEATRFIVMEHVEGRSLSEVLRDDAPLDPAQAANIASSVADALMAAHAAGLVHRDIKPGNVMLASDGAVKVLDFGIARALDGSTLTQNASVLGTAGYMAPEQALGESADERSDIYSLGCLLYALLTGRPPFTGDNAAAVLHQHVNGDPRPPSTVNPRVSPSLDAAVMRMLARSPDARPQTAAEARDRLDAAADGDHGAAAPTASTRRPQGRRAATRGTAPAPHTARTRRLSATADAPRRHRSRRTVAAGALAAVGLLVLAIIALASSGGTGTRATTAHRSAAAAARTTASSKTPAPARPRRSTPPAPVKSTTTAASTASTPPPAPTVTGSVETLGSLLAQGAQSGAVDPHAARQLASGLAEVLGAYEAGRALDARRGVLDLSSRLTALQGQGRITQPAAAPLASSLATLEAAVLRSTPASAQAQGNQPPAAEAPAPGHDGRGHGAEKHRDQQAAPEGD